MNRPNRTRPVHKAVWFSASEWTLVEAKMAAVGHTNFSKWARKMILNGNVLVNSRPMDALKVTAALSMIGNNINQVARRVNIEDVLYVEDLQEIRDLMRRCEKILSRYAKGVQPDGGGENAPSARDIA